MDGQGNLERIWKVSEFEKNGYGRQTSEIYLFCSREKKMFFLMR